MNKYKCKKPTARSSFSHWYMNERYKCFPFDLACLQVMWVIMACFWLLSSTTSFIQNLSEWYIWYLQHRSINVGTKCRNKFKEPLSAGWRIHYTHSGRARWGTVVYRGQVVWSSNTQEPETKVPSIIRWWSEHKIALTTWFEQESYHTLQHKKNYRELMFIAQVQNNEIRKSKC